MSETHYRLSPFLLFFFLANVRIIIYYIIIIINRRDEDVFPSDLSFFSSTKFAHLPFLFLVFLLLPPFFI